MQCNLFQQFLTHLYMNRYIWLQMELTFINSYGSPLIVYCHECDDTQFSFLCSIKYNHNFITVLHWSTVLLLPWKQSVLVRTNFVVCCFTVCLNASFSIIHFDILLNIYVYILVQLKDPLKIKVKIKCVFWNTAIKEKYASTPF